MDAVGRAVLRSLLRNGRHFDQQPVLKALIKRDRLPEELDDAVASFLGSEDRQYHLPSPLQPQSVVDTVRTLFRFPPTEAQLDVALLGMRYLNGLLGIAEKHGLVGDRPAQASPEDAAAPLPASEGNPHDPVRLSSSGSISSSHVESRRRVEVLARPKPGALLLAHPLMDDWFSHTAVLVCKHSAEAGAQGLVINRPLPSSIRSLPRERGRREAQIRAACVASSAAEDPPQEQSALRGGFGKIGNAFVIMQVVPQAAGDDVWKADVFEETDDEEEEDESRPKTVYENSAAAMRAIMGAIASAAGHGNASSPSLVPSSIHSSGGDDESTDGSNSSSSDEASTSSGGGSAAASGTGDHGFAGLDLCLQEPGLPGSSRPSGNGGGGLRARRRLMSRSKHTAAAAGGAQPAQSLLFSSWAGGSAPPLPTGSSRARLHRHLAAIGAALAGAHPAAFPAQPPAASTAQGSQPEAPASVLEPRPSLRHDGHLYSQQGAGSGGDEEEVNPATQPGAAGIGSSGTPGVAAAPTVAQVMELFAKSGVGVGGPVPALQVLHRCSSLGGDLVLPGPDGQAVYLGAELDRAAGLVAEGRLAPQDARFLLGEASWPPGKLEQEIAEGSWVVLQPAPGLLDLFSPAGSIHAPPPPAHTLQAASSATAPANARAAQTPLRPHSSPEGVAQAQVGEPGAGNGEEHRVVEGVEMWEALWGEAGPQHAAMAQLPKELLDDINGLTLEL